MKQLSLLLVAALAACSPAATPENPVITVYADAALTKAFTRIGREFEASQGIRVKFFFGASAPLQKQLDTGVAVYAAASRQTMPIMSKVFAKTRLVIATPYGNPKGIVTVGALSPRSSPQVSFATCVAEAPCSAALTPWFEQAGFGNGEKPKPRACRSPATPNPRRRTSSSRSASCPERRMPRSSTTTFQ